MKYEVLHFLLVVVFSFLESTFQELTTVTVNSINKNKPAKAATLETPLSVHRLTSEKINANPGGNFDISRVIRTWPGIGGIFQYSWM